MPFAIFGDQPKLQPGNQVVTPDCDSTTTVEHPANSLKTRLQEGFSNGWAKGWRHHDFTKLSMSHVEIWGKCCPTVCGSKGI
jgi:hypothetical protein